MGIPPHAARLAGAWAVQHATDRQSALGSGPLPDLLPGPEPTPAPTRPPERHRSHRFAVSRILHPLQRHA
jgi:hypothetical protein